MIWAAGLSENKIRQYTMSLGCKYDKDLMQAGCKMNFHRRVQRPNIWRSSGHIYGGAAATYMEEQRRHEIRCCHAVNDHRNLHVGMSEMYGNNLWV
jgi:hypothetical protein